MSETQRSIVMTIALPYANGTIHLGHLVEAIQADIWARFQRAQGHSCLFISGSDAHGTAIMLAAEKAGMTPEDYIEQVRQDHHHDLKQFHVDFDIFYTSHSPENEALVSQIYKALEHNGDISTKAVTQYFDPEKNIFLADRFIKGTCPKCKSPDQYGDNCEVCGTTYSPTDLIDPYSTLSGAKPIQKSSEHYFFHLENYQDTLEAWIAQDVLQPQVANKLKEWFADGLKPWDISRDAPYFGFKIPGTTDKYFYVWLDAPVGYMGAHHHLSQQQPDHHGPSFEDTWRADSDVELHHFIGKDIMYFHGLFWPAMLNGAGFRQPSKIHVHGYLTIDGAKMSKSRGTFITGKQYIAQLNPECLRYYYAAKLSPSVEDIDLNLSDFMQRVNADLVGKYINLASRTAGFISKKFDGKLASTLMEPALYDDFVKAADTIANHYESLQYSQAVRTIMALADKANQFIDHHQPWMMAKEENQLPQVQLVCTQGLNLFRLLTLYLKPILPIIAANVEDFLKIEPLTWSHRHTPLLDHTINRFKPLLQRITEEDIEAIKA